MEQLRHATIPVLFVHGDADTFVSPRFLDMNFNACSSLDREKLLVPGADHVMGSVVAPDVYWRRSNDSSGERSDCRIRPFHRFSPGLQICMATPSSMIWKP